MSLRRRFNFVCLLNDGPTLREDGGRFKDGRRLLKDPVNSYRAVLVSQP